MFEGHNQTSRQIAAFVVAVVLPLGLAFLFYGLQMGDRHTYPLESTQTTTTPTSDSMETRRCAIVENRKRTTVGEESPVTLNLEECVKDALDRIAKEQDVKTRELILGGRAYADASLLPVGDGLIIREDKRNGIQPVWPQPSWFWTIMPTRAGVHEMILEIRSVREGSEPDLFLSPPITLTTRATEPPTITTATTRPPERTPDSDEGGSGWRNDFTVFGIIALIIAATAGYYAMTGVPPWARAWRERQWANRQAKAKSDTDKSNPQAHQ